MKKEHIEVLIEQGKHFNCPLCNELENLLKQAKKEVYDKYEKYSSVDVEGVRCMLEIVFKKLKNKDLGK